MFVRWIRRPLSLQLDTALDALLVISYWEAGRSRQRVHYLASIRERYRNAPAYRHVFWQRVHQKLTHLDLSETAWTRCIRTLAEQVPLPTEAELHQLMETQALFVTPPDT